MSLTLGLLAALRELVRLKDLHDCIEAGHAENGMGMEYSVAKPKAWDAAREVLGKANRKYGYATQRPPSVNIPCHATFGHGEGCCRLTNLCSQCTWILELEKALGISAG